MPIQKLLSAISGSVTRWNTVYESLLSSAFIITGVIYFLRRYVFRFEDRSKRILILVLFSVLLLNPAHSKNMIWALQVSWGLLFLLYMLLANSICEYRAQLKQTLWIAFLLVLFTGSSLHGLVAHIYIIGFSAVYMISRRDFSFQLLLLAIFAACLLWIYFQGFFMWKTHPSIDYAINNPVNFLTYLLVIIGSPFGHLDQNICVTSSVVLLTTFLFTYCRVSLSQGIWKHLLNCYRKHPLVVMGFGLLLMISIGRAGFSPQQALSPRYGTISLIFSTGIAYYVLKRSSGRHYWSQLIVASLIVMGTYIGHEDAPLRARDTDRKIEAFKSCVLEKYPDIDSCPLKNVYPHPHLLKKNIVLLHEKQLSFFAKER